VRTVPQRSATVRSNTTVLTRFVTQSIYGAGSLQRTALGVPSSMVVEGFALTSGGAWRAGRRRSGAGVMAPVGARAAVGAMALVGAAPSWLARPSHLLRAPIVHVLCTYRAPLARHEIARRPGLPDAPLCSCSRAVIAASTSQEHPPERLRVSLDTREARHSLRFVEARLASSSVRCVIVEAVGVGSEAGAGTRLLYARALTAWAEAAGVRPAQRVLAVSDPVRAGELWQLEDVASARAVRDCLRYRVGDKCILELVQFSEDAVLILDARQNPSSDNSGLSVHPDDVSRRRNARRAARLAEISQRNDSPFFLGVLVWLGN